MAKVDCLGCPFYVLAGTECDGYFAEYVGEGCESDTATEALETMKKEKTDVMHALEKLPRPRGFNDNVFTQVL